ncbi:MAG: ubiquinol oxidase subunit II [Chlamydiia bacterium]
MKRKYSIVLAVLFTLVLIALGIWSVVDPRVVVLHPKGLIAWKQRDLLVTATWLMLIIVIPVFILTAFFAWKYRAGNEKAKYTPQDEGSVLAESIWWGVPCVIIFFLSIMNWNSSYELDPFKPIEHDRKAITIQVVALDWKWLFIYPEEQIATVNFIQFPQDTPISFRITADAPMNSFWIPELAGQVFAMPGMETQLHVLANEEGSFRGVSANLSGRGFAGMTFFAKASTQEEFDQWVQSVKTSAKPLDLKEYAHLVQQSENNPVETYLLAVNDLYQRIIMRYMTPDSASGLEVHDGSAHTETAASF